jgi:hypothetical protein
VDNEYCSECDDPLFPEQMIVIYQGERCHIDCAAEAEAYSDCVDLGWTHEESLKE